jgi:uncharacterized membrane protein YfcA
MLVLICAFAVRSAAGFGAVLIAMPMLAFVLPVSTAVSVTTALTAITSVHQVSRGLSSTISSGCLDSSDVMAWFMWIL